MASLFGKEPNEKPQPTAYERIGPEIAHLKKSTSTRTTPGAVTKKSAPWVITLFVLSIIGLYVMDPFAYAYYKYDAMRAYLYLRAYDSASSTDALVATHIFSEDELRTLNGQHGVYGSYYISANEAQQKAAEIVTYIESVQLLHDKKYEKLGTVNKLRYNLFVQFGLMPPTVWKFLNPKVE